MRPLLLLVLCAACVRLADVASARSAVANVTVATLLSAAGTDSSTLRDALAAVDNDVCRSLKQHTLGHTHMG